jgi:hypothetical protein
MAFGKKAHPPETPPAESTPEPNEQSATERLNSLLAERAELEAAIAGHHEERSQLVRQSEAPSIEAISAIAMRTDEARLRLEWLSAQLPDLYAQLERERVAAWEDAWETHRPGLAASQERLANAIREFHDSLAHAHAVHNAARGFGDRLNEFVRPVPQENYNRWALMTYLDTIERRQQAAPLQAVELSVEFPRDLPPARRFVPKRVAIAEIEAISAIVPPRTIRVLHGPARVASLNFGLARVFAGETHVVPARAAHALVTSGIAEYADEPATVSAA